MLYFECFSGISGDMSVAALLDLGANQEILLDALNSLKLEGYKIEIGRRQKCGIDGASFNVLLTNHEHHHRGIIEIEQIIDAGELITPKAKDLAKKIFNYVARAESLAHAKPIEQVHFHEVGAIDSIIDIVAVAVCIDNLGIDEIAVSTLYEGQGYAKCQHGKMPVPVPAVVNIAKESGLAIKITNTTAEMITPTGIAIAAALKTAPLPEQFSIEKVGIGTGQKDFEHANILRVMKLSSDKKKVPYK
ncbi:MAG: hypothetical protein ATN33_04910 [Epulopiscium sp. Nele67-Bin001]|nr:MAG: hypothetical protein ATN33_04910 [Epulopiscium sp. Nele67-Bin001]